MQSPDPNSPLGANPNQIPQPIATGLSSQGQPVQVPSAAMGQPVNVNSGFGQPAPANYAKPEHDLEEDEDDDDEPRRQLNLPNPIKIIWNTIKTAKNLLSLGCLLIIIALVLLVVAVVFRPPVLWNPLKGFLNAKIEPLPAAAMTRDEILEKVYTDASQTGIITSEELAVLVKSKVGIDSEVRTEISPEGIKILINVDETNSDQPLWLVILLAEDANGKLQVTKLGFERLGLPERLTVGLSTGLGKVLDFIKRDSIEDLLTELIAKSPTERVEISNATLEEDEINITF